tara:strand:- start:333 stop:515 length:183 start_codon:yes stop_codon:yes gene_type:complete
MKFDSQGIFASDDKLKEIALLVLDQEKRERELRREWFAKWNRESQCDAAQFGTWNISDRH